MSDGKVRYGQSDDSQLIRWLRRRLGWTQSTLADRLGVDQGTVSRWENGIERPKPSSYAAIRDLLVAFDMRRAHWKHLAMIRNDMVLGGLYDAESRLVAFSRKAEDRYRQIHGLDLNGTIGKTFEQISEMTNSYEAWKLIQDAELERGNVLLMRASFRYGRRGQHTLFEPVYEEGRYEGLSVMLLEHLRFEEDEPVGLRTLDVVYMDSPHQLHRIYG